MIINCEILIIKLYYIYIHHYDKINDIHHYDKIYNNNDFHFEIVYMIYT